MAVMAVFVRRWNLPLFAAVLLVAGAAGAVVAVNTGKEEEERVEHAVPAAESLLENHERWGENARNAGIVAALLATIAVYFARKPGFTGRVFGVLSALAALSAAYVVLQAAHLGGQLVYRHGAGVTVGKPATAGAPWESPGLPGRGGDEQEEEEGQ
jgi:uncharacterized membrane protein